MRGRRRTVDWILPVRYAGPGQHCRELGVTHFIDDRLDVLVHLRGLVPSLYLFGHQAEPAPGWVTPVLTWPAVLAAVLPELRGTTLPADPGSPASRAPAFGGDGSDSW